MCTFAENRANRKRCAMCTEPRGAGAASQAVAPHEDDPEEEVGEVLAPPSRKRKHSQAWTCGACTFSNEGGRTCEVCGAARSSAVALRNIAPHNAVPPPPTGGDDSSEEEAASGDEAAPARRPSAEDADGDAPMAEGTPPVTEEAAAPLDDGGVAGLLRSMMVSEQTSRQESAAVVHVAACRETVAVATARSVAILRLEGADMAITELRRVASPGGSIAACAIERHDRLVGSDVVLAVACHSKSDDRLLAVYDFAVTDTPVLRARPQGCEGRSKTRLHLDVEDDRWAARWCESYHGHAPIANKWTSQNEWVHLPFPNEDAPTLVRDVTRGEGSKRPWTCAVCASGSETCIIMWDSFGARSFVLPLPSHLYVFCPSGASCRVGRWASAHASDASEAYGSLVCVAHAATSDGVIAVACAVRADHGAAKAASGSARRHAGGTKTARRVCGGGRFLCEAGRGAHFRVHDVVGERSSFLEGEGAIGDCARLCVVDRGAAGCCLVSTHAGDDRGVHFLPLAPPEGES